jgi:ADP-heptose:LPS heptosyltransferase
VLKTLIIRPGAIGDFLLSLPALQFLRTSYTEVWCAGPNVPLARFADRAASIASVGLDRVGFLPADDVLQRLARFDRIYSWYGTAVSEFREAVEKLPIRFYSALPAASGMHATDFYCSQVGAPVAPPRLDIPLIVPGGFTVIHPFASNPQKRWPLERFRELALQLADVRWCAGPEEPLENAIRIPDLYELACWLAHADLFIGNDSGITHLAAAVGIPVIALFGPTDPAVWSPRGERVTVLNKSELTDISVIEVLAACPAPIVADTMP